MRGEYRVSMMNDKRMKNHNSGFSLIELIIVITIMAILVGILTPMFYKYVLKSKKSKDVYVADQIARATQLAFVEHPDLYDKFLTFNNNATVATVTAVYNGVSETYDVQLIAACEGPTFAFNGTALPSSFYSKLNSELGLNPSGGNEGLMPQYTEARTGGKVVTKSGRREEYAEIHCWRIVRRKDNNLMEVWAAQRKPAGGWPIYRVWPDADDLYSE